MEQDTEQLFAAIAIEKGFLSTEQAAECKKARDEAGRLGLKVTLAKVTQDRGLLSLEQVREIHREMRKRGTTIRLGRYELLEKVGAGGMGAVWRARDTVLKRTVAIKLLPRHRATDSRFITRFRREATLASRIQHPNVVTVYEIGRSGDRHYIAMEFVEGETVAERLKGGEVLSESGALDIGRQVCEGLLVAHELGIIHRDIKPSNIMITPSGLVKVADLGLAKAIEEEGPGLTHSGAVLGTPRYMSPEQCRSARNLDRRTDIYSLGATLFHMLTGRPPYEGETPYEIMRQHEDAAPPDVRDHAPGVSAGARDLVRSMLAKDPDQRPQSCSEIIAAIERIASQGGEIDLHSGLPSHDPSAATREARRPTPGIALNSPTPTASMHLQPRSRMGLRLGALILVILVLSVAAVVWLTSLIRRYGTPIRRDTIKDQGGVREERPEEAAAALGRIEAKNQREAEQARLRAQYEEGYTRARRFETAGKWAEAKAEWISLKTLGAQLDAKPASLVRLDGLIANCEKRLGPALPEVLRNAGWKAESRRVKVGTPDADTEKEIVYYTNTIGMEFVLIPPGEFMMGSPVNEEKRRNVEGPQHRVRIAKGFYLGMCEVTQAQYEAVLGKNPSYFKGGDNPVEQVSWNDAVEFCRELSRKSGMTYRLPTEAEWEYACRAGTVTKYGFGDAEANIAEYAWYRGNSGKRTHAVGGRKPNAFGLYDMHGNVWEWCQSLYKPYPYREDDGREDLRTGGSRALRGGYWYRGPTGCRSAVRCGYNPADRYFNFGFRVVLVGVSPTPPAAAGPTDGGRPEPKAKAMWPFDATEANRRQKEAEKAVALPNGWTKEVRRTKVGTPQGDRELDITHYTNTIGMQFVVIPKGEFMMGSRELAATLVQAYAPHGSGYTDEGPLHRVKLTRDIHVGAHEVTVGQFRKFVEATGGKALSNQGKGGYALTNKGGIFTAHLKWSAPGFRQSDRHPVVCVSWHDARAFCQWLSRKEGLTYRLPTEAEWEYACRAGSDARFFFGNDDGKLHLYGDFADRSANSSFSDRTQDDGFPRTAPVGSYLPNAWGLSDMHGNVWEPCVDWYAADYYERSPDRDPIGPASGRKRVLRGGSWSSMSGGCRAANHACDLPKTRRNDAGFRVVCEP